MDYAKLGRSGLKVSRICLGCMSFGAPERGDHAWTLDERASREIIQRALELGINHFDTANIYSDGSSEEITGRALRDFARRDEVVIATKVHGRMRGGANAEGLSRKAILCEVEASLRRLGTDYIDLYQIHRWDDDCPIDETLEALTDVIKAGKVCYIGASSMKAWQFATALYKADLGGWSRFVSMQNHLNLLYREDEREMVPLCRSEGVGMLPWSPLARGRLSRGHEAATARSRVDAVGSALYRSIDESSDAIIDAVGRVAASRSTSRSQIALAWILSQQGIVAPIVGATKLAHVEDAAAAVALHLSAEERRTLEEHYVPQEESGLRLISPR
jgi:aryl-alcohol dehydrogenase-like predicted oxidoreductase